jgi:hypothetical protein
VDYFRFVSFFLVILLGPAVVWLFAAPGSYRRLAERVLTEKRPGWFIVTWILMLAWVIYTWYRFLQVPNGTTLVLTVILSLTLIKGYYAVFRYETFRSFSLKFVGLGEGFLRVMALVYLALALAFLGIGFSL